MSRPQVADDFRPSRGALIFYLAISVLFLSLTKVVYKYVLLLYILNKKWPISFIPAFL